MDDIKHSEESDKEKDLPEYLKKRRKRLQSIYRQSGTGELNEGISGAVKGIIKAYALLKTVQMFTNTWNSDKLPDTPLPTGNLGIRRADMPQIQSDRMPDFIIHAGKNGVKFKEMIVPIKDLTLTQNEYNHKKVVTLANKIKGKSVDSNKPVVISNDGFVIDGTHRYLATHFNNPDGKIKVLKSSANFKQTMSVAKSFSGVAFRNVSGAEIEK